MQVWIPTSRQVAITATFKKLNVFKVKTNTNKKTD